MPAGRVQPHCFIWKWFVLAALEMGFPVMVISFNPDQKNVSDNISVAQWPDADLWWFGILVLAFAALAVILIPGPGGIGRRVQPHATEEGEQHRGLHHGPGDAAEPMEPAATAKRQGRNGGGPGNQPSPNTRAAVPPNEPVMRKHDEEDQLRCCNCECIILTVLRTGYAIGLALMCLSINPNSSWDQAVLWVFGFRLAVASVVIAVARLLRSPRAAAAATDGQ